MLKNENETLKNNRNMVYKRVQKKKIKLYEHTITATKRRRL